jgi:hypothetical protein
MKNHAIPATWRQSKVPIADRVWREPVGNGKGRSKP